MFFNSESQVEAVLRILRRWLSEYKEMRILIVPPLYRGIPANFSDDIAVSMVVFSKGAILPCWLPSFLYFPKVTVNSFCDKQRCRLPLLHTSLNSSLLETDQIRLTRSGFDRYFLSVFPRFWVLLPWFVFRYVDTTFSSAIIALAEIKKRVEEAGDDISVMEC